MNFDATNATSIGTWGPTVATNTSPPTTLTWTVTPFVTNSGDINLDFHYASGNNAINIFSVTLLANNVQVDTDNTGYVAFAGLSAKALPYFVLHLKTYQPGAVYTIQATVAGVGGSNSSGNVYMVNWN
jgi:hypothetical protein